MHTIFLSTKGPNLSTCTGVNTRVSTHGPINLSQQLGFQSLGPRFKPAALSLSLKMSVMNQLLTSISSSSSALFGQDHLFDIRYHCPLFVSICLYIFFVSHQSIWFSIMFSIPM